MQSGHQACFGYQAVRKPFQPPSAGTGPLLQRDYWAELAGCTLKPSELIAHLRSHFCQLPPRALVSFAAAEGVKQDAILDIRIRPAQVCQVRVAHLDAQSVTLATLAGHPEAGRITFGAYRNTAGALIFHIRSRARAAAAATRLGFFAIGEAMQTNTWTDFINNLAQSVGAHIAGSIHADTREVEADADDEEQRLPTFRAVGD